jgi:hypothetical protein
MASSIETWLFFSFASSFKATPSSTSKHTAMMNTRNAMPKTDTARYKSIR